MKYECDAWKRSLEFMEFENNFLLDHLASLLKVEDDSSFIENAEYYQADIIAGHKKLRNLRLDLASLERLLTLEQFEDGKILKQAGRKYRQVKKSMEEAEDHFNQLKNNFNSYIARVL